MGSSLKMSSDHGETFQLLEMNYSDGMFDLKNDPVNHNLIWASFYENGEAKVIRIDVSNPDVINIESVNLPSFYCSSVEITAHRNLIFQ